MIGPASIGVDVARRAHSAALVGISVAGIVSRHWNPVKRQTDSPNPSDSADLVDRRRGPRRPPPSLPQGSCAGEASARTRTIGTVVWLGCMSFFRQTPRAYAGLPLFPSPGDGTSR